MILSLSSAVIVFNFTSAVLAVPSMNLSDLSGKYLCKFVNNHNIESEATMKLTKKANGACYEYLWDHHGQKTSSALCSSIEPTRLVGKWENDRDVGVAQFSLKGDHLVFTYADFYKINDRTRIGGGACRKLRDVVPHRGLG